MDELTGLVITRKDGRIWVRLPGSITHDNSILIQNQIEDVLRNRVENVVLDLSGLNSVYSMTIALIMQVRERVLGGGGSLSLVNVSHVTDLQLRSVHLDKVLSIYADEKEMNDHRHIEESKASG